MSNADDRCARRGCGKELKYWRHLSVSHVDYHSFEPAPQPAPSGDPCHCGHPFTARCKSTAPSDDEAKVRALDMCDETLVAEIAFEVGQATKMQPSMDGRCRRLHDDAENRRIARAAIRAINRIARRGSEGT